MSLYPTIPQATPGETYLSLSVVVCALKGHKDTTKRGHISAAMFQSPAYFPRMNWDGKWLWGAVVISTNPENLK